MLNLEKKCKKINGFYEDDFIQYMINNYHIDRYSEDLIRSIIKYAQKHEHVSKDMFCEFLEEMLPYVEKLHVARFCDDEILSDETLEKLGRN